MFRIGASEDVVDIYNGLLDEGKADLEVAGICFNEIERRFGTWDRLKKVYDVLHPSILRQMVVHLLAKAASTTEELEETLLFCDDNNPGPRGLVQDKLVKLSNV